MICPNCGAEYRPGFTTCADCEVPLVAAPEGRQALPASGTPRQGKGFSSADPGDPNDDPFCSFWKGADARVCTELCTVLDEAGIPHKTIHRQDHLFNFANQVPFEVGVPASLYERAENAIKEAFGIEEAGQRGTPMLPAPDKNPADFEKELRDAIVDANEWLGERYPEDATVEVWSGREADTKEMIRMSLEENDMISRSEEDAGQARLFVLPEDAERAKEIVRQIVEGQPPR